MYRLAVVGSRGFRPLHQVDHFLEALAQRARTLEICIVSGGARGVDRRAVRTARYLGFKTDELLADWEHYGIRAGLLRNTDIVECCDGLVAFWDSVSRGTQDVVSKARKAGKLLKVVEGMPPLRSVRSGRRVRGL